MWDRYKIEEGARGATGTVSLLCKPLWLVKLNISITEGSSITYGQIRYRGIKELILLAISSKNM